jgi:hypothetical protein
MQRSARRSTSQRRSTARWRPGAEKRTIISPYGGEGVPCTGLRSDRIDGTVFEIADVELAAADEYEVAAYKRIAVVLASGLDAWVYVDARYAPDR